MGYADAEAETESENNKSLQMAKRFWARYNRTRARKNGISTTGASAKDDADTISVCVVYDNNVCLFSDALRAVPSWICPLKMTLHTQVGNANPPADGTPANTSFAWGSDVPVELKLQNVSLTE